MTEIANCDWCNNLDLEWRIIRSNELWLSFVSKPWFRDGHCLVIPRRHISAVNELSVEESAGIMGELGRLSKLLDKGFGSGLMQKYMPKQSQNGVKMNHLHFHVFPRREHEEGLFPTPYPNSFDSFYAPNENEVQKLVSKLH
jgi:diadenosine tetraphosphate (Ap4A) HIT family hydrolase